MVNIKKNKIHTYVISVLLYMAIFKEESIYEKRVCKTNFLC